MNSIISLIYLSGFEKSSYSRGMPKGGGGGPVALAANEGPIDWVFGKVEVPLKCPGPIEPGPRVNLWPPTLGLVDDCIGFWEARIYCWDIDVLMSSKSWY